MDETLVKLAKEYRSKWGFSGSADAVYHLYDQYVKKRKEALMELVDAAASGIAVDALFLQDQISFDQITPEMKEAFALAYPNEEIGVLSRLNPSEIEGYLRGWKGKFFEVLVRDRLNDGEWVGALHIEPGQTAQLAGIATQAEWDLRILGADGAIVDELQLKATESLSYIKSALEHYPEIKVLTTEEIADKIADSTEDLSEAILFSGISDNELEYAIGAPVEELLDSGLEEFIEDVSPFLPFIIIAVSEGIRVVRGHKTWGKALKNGAVRTGKAGAAITVGYAAACLFNCGLISVPIAILVRLGFGILSGREQRNKRIVARLDMKIASFQKLQAHYKGMFA